MTDARTPSRRSFAPRMGVVVNCQAGVSAVIEAGADDVLVRPIGDGAEPETVIAETLHVIARMTS